MLPRVDALVAACILVMVSGMRNSPIALMTKKMIPNEIHRYPSILSIFSSQYIEPSKYNSTDKTYEGEDKSYIKVECTLVSDREKHQ